ncbi:CubicO group peptidase (beta-lactamase class C family) [Chitinophaga dinghuensis]|uniref:CubicO group peptidase (Beta-lactamase class C family) n=1 Tax=Chitinophaga dinghuensis TaxID=1539050 RepID=A0A327VQB0_9BACT|nr:serine hydrolase domain-containing protein [Chitinophaga dinghuensis]RAJ76636.1 CubicO group peptidase (beta-lactamase class C family) [Chitinophaga dinghuensis]
MRLLNIKLFVFAGILTFLFQISSSSLYAQRTIDQLNANLQAMYKSYKLPGFSIAIVNKGKVIYENGYGYADIKARKPFTPTTIQNIGSISKTFVAVALMKAIEHGYFTLETNINDILPFKVSNPYFPNDSIKIKHLVTHTSGIVDRNEIYYKSYIWDTKNISILKELLPSSIYSIMSTGADVDTTLKDFMYSYLNSDGKFFTKENFYDSRPGERSEYSNIASALAAYLIECKSGKSFSEYSELFILTPLKMFKSGWFLKSIDLSQHTKLYAENMEVFPLYQLVTYPDGGLRTSVDDLSKYVIEMIKGFNGKSDILSQKFYVEMFTPQLFVTTPPKNINLNKRNKGIFWNLYPTGYIGHDGDDPGISTCLRFNPKTKTGYVFLTNIMATNEVLSGEIKSIEKVLEDFCDSIRSQN